MRGEEFLEKMELIDPAFVETAEVIPQKRNIVWIKWAAAAACLCLAIVGGVVLGRQNLSIDSEFSSIVPEPNSKAESSAFPPLGSRPENEGVTIPKSEFSLAPNPTADMIGFFYYEGRCYVQQFEPIYDGADLIGAHLGTAIGRIDEWTPEDGYVDFAGSVWGNIYAVKGYDPSFMLCMRDPTGIVRPFICDNGITLTYGSELFEDRLHLSGRFTAVQYVSSDSQSGLYELNGDGDTVENFIAELDSARFVLSDDVPLPEGATYLGATELYRLYFRMEDGTTVSLRLHENGYVCLEGMWEVCLQVPEESYQALLHILDSHTDSTAADPPKTVPTLEDCLNDPELGDYLPAYVPDNFTVEGFHIQYYPNEETSNLHGTKEISMDYADADYLGGYSVTVTWTAEYEQNDWAWSVIDASDVSAETLSGYMKPNESNGLSYLSLAVRYGNVTVALFSSGLTAETAYNVFRSVPSSR